MLHGIIGIMVNSTCFWYCWIPCQAVHPLRSGHLRNFGPRELTATAWTLAARPEIHAPLLGAMAPSSAGDVKMFRFWPEGFLPKDVLFGIWNMFYFSIYWEESSQLTIFQRGWNHQPVIKMYDPKVCQGWYYCKMRYVPWSREGSFSEKGGIV